MRKAPLGMFLLLLLVAMIAVSCDQCPEGPPGTVIVIGEDPSGDPSWEMDATGSGTMTAQLDGGLAGGKIRDDFLGQVENLTCAIADGDDADRIEVTKMTFTSSDANVKLTISEESDGSIKWVLTKGAGTATLASSGQSNTGKVPTEFFAITLPGTREGTADKCYAPRIELQGQ